MMRSLFGRNGMLAAAAFVAVVLTIVMRAPAAWVGDWVQSRGPLRLVDASGTIWRGSAMLGVSDGKEITLVPGRISWTIGMAALFSGRVTADLSHPALAAPLHVSLAARSVTVAGGRAELPAATLLAAGVPFNTVRPGGTLALQWTDIGIQADGLTGKAEVEWRDARSALSPVAPLGSYRLSVTSGNPAALIHLETLNGPLRLEGKGTLKGWRISFRGLASAAPDMRPALNGLIGVLGPRSGNDVLLALDT
jgi:general secretion pathway protein N